MEILLVIVDVIAVAAAFSSGEDEYGAASGGDGGAKLVWIRIPAIDGRGLRDKWERIQSEAEECGYRRGSQFLHIYLLDLQEVIQNTGEPFRHEWEPLCRGGNRLGINVIGEAYSGGVPAYGNPLWRPLFGEIRRKGERGICQDSVLSGDVPAGVRVFVPRALPCRPRYSGRVSHLGMRRAAGEP